MSRDLDDRMRKPCEHIEEMQKSASTRLLRNEKSLTHSPKRKYFVRLYFTKQGREMG